MILSIDTEKAFEKLQHPFMIMSPESGHRGNLLQHNKDNLQQTHSKHHFHSEKRKHFLHDQE